jgi:prepilin-type N-terminal cleavage/methylation domain-containing protein
MNLKKNQGFTLIEIAIVLVIIGLLLGGVLKGQELINNAKVKSYATDFRNIPVQLYGFQDKFKALPGDDPLVATHVPGATLATTPAGTVGNGVINGAWNTTTNTDESCLFWQHVRLSGFGNGSTTVSCAAASDYWPKNANGGQIGIQGNVGLATFSAGNGPPGTYAICSANISGQFVLQLDGTLDDGNPATGSMRAIQTSAAGGAPSTTAVVQANLADSFIVCMGI